MIVFWLKNQNAISRESISEKSEKVNFIGRIEVGQMFLLISEPKHHSRHIDGAPVKPLDRGWFAPLEPYRR